jgi:hypothetical protein
MYLIGNLVVINHLNLTVKRTKLYNVVAVITAISAILKIVIDIIRLFHGENISRINIAGTISSVAIAIIFFILARQNKATYKEQSA